MDQENQIKEVPRRYEKPLVEVFDANDLLEVLGTAVCQSVTQSPIIL